MMGSDLLRQIEQGAMVKLKKERFGLDIRSKLILRG